MELNPRSDYDVLFNLPTNQIELNERLKVLRQFTPPEGMEIYDSSVPGLNGALNVPFRVYKQPDAKNAPLLINIHGGGFVSGDLDNDNTRAASIAKNVPCTVISVQYRLSPNSIFPNAMEDCYAVLMYAHQHAKEFGIDRDRIAIFGTSAGGCITAGLCLYLRDKGGPKISMQLLNFPMLDYLANTTSALQFFEGTPLVQGKEISKMWEFYLGGFNGTMPSYYAVPALARDLAGLPASLIITCEYDPLRTEGMDYARRLMEFAVPTELYSLPRVPHGFDLVPAPLTEWIREGIYHSLRREFGML